MTAEVRSGLRRKRAHKLICLARRLALAPSLFTGAERISQIRRKGHYAQPER